MSNSNKGHPTFDHMPAELAKAIAEQAKQQAQTTSQATTAQKSGGGEQKKQ
ncbi:TPA: hypothetical protein ACPZLH_000678 [Yersinia enterocolitica]